MKVKSFVSKISDFVSYFLILRKIRKQKFFFHDDILKIFEMSNTEKIVKLYIQKHSLCYKSMLRIFERPNTEEIVKLNI